MKLDMRSRKRNKKAAIILRVIPLLTFTCSKYDIHYMLPGQFFFISQVKNIYTVECIVEIFFINFFPYMSSTFHFFYLLYMYTGALLAKLYLYCVLYCISILLNTVEVLRYWARALDLIIFSIYQKTKTSVQRCQFLLSK